MIVCAFFAALHLDISFFFSKFEYCQYITVSFLYFFILKYINLCTRKNFFVVHKKECQHKRRIKTKTSRAYAIRIKIRGQRVNKRIKVKEAGANSMSIELRNILSQKSFLTETGIDCVLYQTRILYDMAGILGHWNILFVHISIDSNVYAIFFKQFEVESA